MSTDKYVLRKTFQPNFVNFNKQQKICLLSSSSLLFVNLIFILSTLCPLLITYRDFKRHNMETAQRGSRFYSLIASAANYSAQHAESVSSVDPFPPLSYLFVESLILSRTPQDAPRNLSAWLNGNFYGCPYPEWQLALVDWGKNTE